MIRPRLQQRIATATALLALLLRLLLPALHDERAHRSSAASSTAVLCSCGQYHAPARDHGAPERAERADPAATEAHVCLACQVQASTPGSPPPKAEPFALHTAIARLQRAPPTAPPAVTRTSLPPSRGPPLPA